MAIVGTEELLVKTTSGTIVKTNTINDVKAYIGPGLPTSPIANAIAFVNSGATAFANSSILTFDGTTLSVIASAASSKPIVIKAATSQTASLLETQNSAGTAQLLINSDHCLIPATNNTLALGTSGNQFNSLHTRESYQYGAATSAYVKTFVPSNGSSYAPEIDFFVGGSRKAVFGYDGIGSRGIFYCDVLGQGMYMFDGSGIALGNSHATYSSNQFLFNAVDTVNLCVIRGTTSSAKVLVLKGASGQSNNILEMQDNSAAVLSRINKSGHFISAQTTAPADGDLNNGEVCVYWDGTDLKIKAKTSGGTIKSGTVTLS